MTSFANWSSISDAGKIMYVSSMPVNKLSIALSSNKSSGSSVNSTTSEGVNDNSVPSVKV